MIYDKGQGNGGTKYDSPTPRWIPKLVCIKSRAAKFYVIIYVFYSLNTFRDETLYIKMTCEVIQVEIEIRKWTEFISFHDINNKIFLFDTQIKVQGTVVNLFDILFVVKYIPWLNHVLWYPGPPPGRSSGRPTAWHA